MTATCGERPARAVHGTVVSVMSAGVSPQGLGAALAARTAGRDVYWRVVDGTDPARTVDIVVCPFTLCRVAARRFPAAMVAAIAPSRQSSETILRAYEAGASVFVESFDLTVAAAHIVAAARRGGLIVDHQQITT